MLSRNDPFDKGVILLLLGPRAAITANPIAVLLRPRRLDALAVGWVDLATPLLLLASYLKMKSEDVLFRPVVAASQREEWDQPHQLD